MGSDDGEILIPQTVAVDKLHRKLFVIDVIGRVQVFDVSTELARVRYITQWGRHGSGEGEFNIRQHKDIAMGVDSAGRVYVADRVNERTRVQVFVP
jgi:hypothetical protein